MCKLGFVGFRLTLNEREKLKGLSMAGNLEMSSVLRTLINSAKVEDFSGNKNSGVQSFDAAHSAIQAQ